jgi:hypothetical protein
MAILTDNVDLAWLHRSACHSILLVSDSNFLILEFLILERDVMRSLIRGCDAQCSQYRTWRLLALSHVRKKSSLRLWKEA